MAKPKFCPCCGEKASIKGERTWWDGIEGVWWVECDGCGLRTAKYKTQKWAKEAWNRRANDAN